MCTKNTQLRDSVCSCCGSPRTGALVNRLNLPEKTRILCHLGPSCTCDSPHDVALQLKGRHHSYQPPRCRLPGSAAIFLDRCCEDNARKKRPLHGRLCFQSGRLRQLLPNRKGLHQCPCVCSSCLLPAKSVYHVVPLFQGSRAPVPGLIVD